ncbi:MAG: glucokinase [Boseongicola sp.]
MHGDQSVSCLLVADVGGTNTRAALACGENLRVDTISRYRNSDYGSLEELLVAYVDEYRPESVSGAAVAVAGPVQDGRSELTNVDWSIEEATIAKATGASRVAVLNDLQAQGYAVSHLDNTQLRTVVSGSKHPAPMTCLVVGVGTGFNASPVHRAGAQLHVPPSEAGHANLPLAGDDDLDLWRFINAENGFPAVEDVLSGRGLENVYRWRRQRSGVPGHQAAEQIVAACESGQDQAAVEAVNVFARILGTACGNLSLIHMPFGGVYLVGGVARAIAPLLELNGFADAFRNKGRFTDFMDNFSVHVIEDDYAALQGLAVFLES